MLRKILLIVNPISGDIDKSELLATAEIFFQTKQIEYQIYHTKGRNDVAQIRQIWQDFLPDRIVVAGGDGTIKLVAEAIEGLNSSIGILPFGSANGLAADLNLPNNLEEALAISLGNKMHDIDMLSINGKKSLHLSDIGVNAQLVKNYQNGSTRGMLGYALQAFTTLINLDDPFKAVVIINNLEISCEARMIVIANSAKYGTGVVINPTGLINDGKFEVILLKNLDLMTIGKIISGNMPVEKEDVEIFSCEEAKIQVNKPVHFQIDGEYVGEETHIHAFVMQNKIAIAVG